jgi:hypothetical protein
LAASVSIFGGSVILISVNSQLARPGRSVRPWRVIGGWLKRLPFLALWKIVENTTAIYGARKTLPL